MSKIIGIDLGTTNSAVAYVGSSGPEIIENREGARTTPSVVAISKKGERLVGISAKRQAVTNPEKTIYGVKRFIGHKYTDKTVQKDKETAPFEIKESKHGGVDIVLDKAYSPEEISAMILRKLKEDAEARLGEKVTEAIITVPAYFDDSQRKATKNAGRIAGLEVKRIINEPTAAALAYGFDKKVKDNQKIAVFDFGGGTFDISILEIGNEVVEVKSTGGDSHLGGRDIDRKILDYVVSEFKKESGIDLSSDTLAIQRLDEAVEKAKIELSSSLETEINIPFVTSNESGPQHLLIKLTRSQLEDLAKPFIDRALDISKNVVKDCDCKLSDIKEIILVGGQTRMPLIQKLIKEFFKIEPNKTINPDEVVAIGAAIQGGILSGDVKDVLLLDVSPLSLGIETMGSVSTKLIEKNTTLPTTASQTFSTAADNQTTVEINILQGERAMAADNKSLGRFILDGIDAAPRGTPQVEVSFDIDTNGILTVTAKDKKTNKEQSIKIEASSNLSEAEIEQMKKDAEINSDKDKEKKEMVELKNTAENSILDAQKLASKEDTKPEIKEEINTIIKDLKDAIEKESKEIINEKMTQLNTSVSNNKAQETEQEVKNPEPDQKPNENN